MLGWRLPLAAVRFYAASVQRCIPWIQSVMNCSHADSQRSRIADWKNDYNTPLRWQQIKKEALPAKPKTRQPSSNQV
jgi:hypothetical protein